MQCFDDDSDDCYINACDEAIANWNAARSQLQTFAYGSVGASTSQLVMNQGTAQHASQPLPYCPHSCCPGVFTHCGGRLSWIQLDAASSGRSDQHSGFFGCERFSSSSRCAFKYWPHPVQRYAQVSMEMEASGNSFRVVPAPGAEAAVARAGGIRTILSSWLRLPTIPPALPQGDGSLAMSYPLSEYEKVERLARDYKKNLLADNESSLIPQPTLKSYRQQSLSPSDQSMMDDEDLNTRISKMPRSLFNALLPFQREGVSFGIRKNARVLIADEMGVGKTLQGIALASCYQETWPLLIIVPAALRLMWAEELEKWLPALVRPGDIHLIEGSKTRVERSKKLPLITITSYEMAGRLTCKACKQEGGKELGEAKKAKNPPPCEGGDCLASMGFNFVLVDESHNLRTSSNVKAEDTDKAKASSIIALRAKHAVFLTGTPSLSKPHDLYRQVATLAPHIFTSKDAFEKRYCDKRIVPILGSRFGRPTCRCDVSGGSRLIELHGLLKREVMIRRLKKDVAGQLPPKRRQVIRLPMPLPDKWPDYPEKKGKRGAKKEEEEDDGKEEESDAGEEEEEKGVEEKDRPVRMSRAHKTGLAKIDSVIEWLLEALGAPVVKRTKSTLAACEQRQGPAPIRNEAAPADAEDEGGTILPQQKILVFAHHRDVMDRLEDALQMRGDSFSGQDKDEPTWNGVGMVRIDGEMLEVERQEKNRRFKNDPSCQVALLSIYAASVGLDFNTASIVVFAELPAEVSFALQAEDRAHRRGNQSSCVNVYYLLAKGTSDEQSWQKLSTSLFNMKSVHDGDQGDEEGGEVPRGLVVDSVLDLETDVRVGTIKMTHPAQSHSESMPSVVAATDSEFGPSVLLPCTENDGPSVVFESEDSAEEEEEEVTQGSSKRQKILPLFSRLGEINDPPYKILPSLPPLAPPPPPPPPPLPLPVPLCSDGPSLDDANVDVWFEVSAHSGRLHFYYSERVLLGFSLPITMLAGSSDPDSDNATWALCLKIVELFKEAQKEEEEATSFVGPFGLVHLPNAIKPHQLVDILSEGRQFSKEWTCLSAMVKNRLCGHILESDLALEVDKLSGRATEDKATTSRYIQDIADRPLPEGCEWKMVRVKRSGPRRMLPEDPQVDTREAKQGIIIATGKRLCNHCLRPVKDESPPFETLRPDLIISHSDLFCGVACESAYSTKSSSNSIRRQLLKIERGVCQICQLKADELAKSLRCILYKSKNWEAKRRAVLLQKAPTWSAAKGTEKTLVDRVIKSPLDGHLWQADHIVPVYEGGGACDLSNLRTLCSICHHRVTSKQTKERAAAKRRKELKTKDIRTFLSPGSQAPKKANAESPLFASRGQEKMLRLKSLLHSGVEDMADQGEEKKALEPESESIEISE